MEETNRAEHETPALRFLLNGDFTDFQIRARGYEFNVHRYVIASNSEYFENVCTSRFKEAHDGCVDFDEDPLLIAILIVGLYTGSYGNHFDDLTAHKLMKTAFRSQEGSLATTPQSHPSYKLHAIMFALAEYYGASKLVACADKQFRETMMSTEPKFNLNALVDVIDLLYNQHLTISDTLRAFAVCYAQTCSHDLTEMPSFLKLFDSSPTFAWDFAMRYSRGSWLFCPVCNRKVSFKPCYCKRSCNCTVAGSWPAHLLTNKNIEVLRCGGCGTNGQLLDIVNYAGDGRDATTIGESALSDSCRSLPTAYVEPDSSEEPDISDGPDLSNGWW